MANKEKKSRRIKREDLLRAKSILRYLRPYKLHFLLGMFLLVMSSLTTLLVPRLMGQLAGIGLSEEGQESYFSVGSWEFDLMNLKTVGFLLLCVFLVQGLVSFFKVYIFSYVSEHMMRDLRADLFAHMLRLPMDYFIEQKVGELNSRISADIASIQETFTTTLAEFIRQIIVIVLGLSFLFYISSKLALVMLATFPVMILVALLFGRHVRKLAKKTQELVAESNVLVQESLMGIVNVKTFTNEWLELNQYRESVGAVKDLAIRTSIWRGLFAAFIIIFLFGAIALVMGVGSLLIQDGLAPGLFISFLLYTVMIGASFGGVASQYSAIQRSLGAVESLFEIMDVETEKIELKRPSSRAVEGELRFEKVSFSYPSRPDAMVIHDLNLEVLPGQTVALVGASGAGKSTIASLLLGLYEAQSGRISIDGKSFEEMGLQEARANMAYVPQEVLLFAGSIYDNIAYGAPGADQEAVYEAARAAQAIEFIERFEEGMDSLVGDRGIQLSGGQKQRIAIARALLRDPAILILDEATSSLDSTSEAMVQRALENLMKGRTSLVIAHRLSTIRNADKIVVLDAGKVVESGRHEDLIGLEGGLYAKLRQSQDLGSN